MPRASWTSSLSQFLAAEPDAVLGALARGSSHGVVREQQEAWVHQIAHLKRELAPLAGYGGEDLLCLEFAIPRMGRYVDALLLLGGVVFVIEYKVGEQRFASHAIDQVMDYALDLKHFHEPSHEAVIAPILVATGASTPPYWWVESPRGDGLLRPLCCGGEGLGRLIRKVLGEVGGGQPVLRDAWLNGRYLPTPTIVEAAQALYAGHEVAEVSRHDACATNLTRTSHLLEQIIRDSRDRRRKSLCLVTGVPGAGKTLVGLNIATRHTDPESELYAVFLSGNGPLVKVLHEALARDRVRRAQAVGQHLSKSEARSQVKAFIQNVHHFRDEGLRSLDRPPVEHVALFDEAQRAWDLEQTARFMQRRRGLAGFSQSEPQFLLSCMDRHRDWATVVCLVGGGQEINTGEAGVRGWLEALAQHFPHWEIHAPPVMHEPEYGAADLLDGLLRDNKASLHEDLHLRASVRSFRAEAVSEWVKAVLDGDADRARKLYNRFRDRYPIVLTRDMAQAREWTRSQARGSERYGLMVSSQAQRLKPWAIDVRVPIDPVHWFLGDKDDVRSSYYLEDAATEFHVQGLEVDWGCVAWDADLRRARNGWRHFSFRGKRWQRVCAAPRQRYQLNAYRVLLTRARQGMVIAVPPGDRRDPTRDPEWYDGTWRYLSSLGLEQLD